MINKYPFRPSDADACGKGGFDYLFAMVFKRLYQDQLMTPLIDMRFPEVAVPPEEHGAAVGTYIKNKYSNPQVE